MSRLLRAGTKLALDERHVIELLSDVAVADIWISDDQFAGWLWNLDDGRSLAFHAEDLRVVKTEEVEEVVDLDADGNPLPVGTHEELVTKYYDRTYGLNAVKELVFVSEERVPVEPEKVDVTDPVTGEVTKVDAVEAEKPKVVNKSASIVDGEVVIVTEEVEPTPLPTDVTVDDIADDDSPFAFAEAKTTKKKVK